MKNKPVKQFRSGNITVSIWKNDKGGLSATTQKTYRDGDEWKETGTLFDDDLIVLAALATRASAWMNEQ